MARNITDTFIAPSCEADIDIIDETSAYVVIHKPSGLLSLSGKNPLNTDSVHHRLQQCWQDIRLIHRLDFGTSGLMVLAKTKAFAVAINQQFQARLVEKHYEAILEGQLKAESGVIEAPIARDDANFPKMQICEHTGKTAVTRFQVIQRIVGTDTRDTTRVRYQPMTGRTHQLRIHSAYIGHPIVGCDIYGNGQLSGDRLKLHASQLSFLHPNDGERMTYQSPAPF